MSRQRLVPVAIALVTLTACFWGVHTTEDADLTLIGPGGERFGYAMVGEIDLDNDAVAKDVAIGAPNPGSDRVYIFPWSKLKQDGELDTAKAFVFQGERNGEAGWALAGGGLVEDWRPDLAIAAPSEAGGKGQIHIIEGGTVSDDIDGSDAFTTITGEQPDDYAGWSLATGDFNGDWRTDLVVGACGADGFKGAAYVLFGPLPKGDISLADADVAIRGVDASGRLGCAVTATDLDGNGTDELVLGGYQEDELRDMAPGGHGKVRIFWDLKKGDRTVDEIEDQVVFVGEGWGQFLGYAIDGGRDVNGDGIEDLLIGGPYRHCHRFNDEPERAGGSACLLDAPGKAYVVLGSKDNDTIRAGFELNIADVADLTITGTVPTDEVGMVVKMAGDLNNDNIEDMFIGTHAIHKGFVFYGAKGIGTAAYMDETTDAAHATFDGTASGLFAGSGAARVGDLNSDGIDDLLFSAPAQEWFSDGPQDEAGEAYIFRGQK